MHRFDQGAAAFLTDGAALIRGLTANVGFDRIQLSDPPQGLLGKRRLRRDVDVVELAPRVCPAECQLRRLVSGRGHQAAKPGIAFNLEQATEALKVTGRMLALAVFAEDIGGGRMTGPRPSTVVAGITLQAPGHGAPATGVQHRQSGIVGNDLG